ncbi:hypothetical protein [Oceanobacillus jeddahense]|uniref:hypothetical protein n=1 Tax=Oceanobacillus jeddahense TaxID=1462527 RepID=UPI000693CBCE|nr:hypothetical protein [Oceanobacillus jeddahense]
MELNRTQVGLDRNARNNENKNWELLERGTTNLQTQLNDMVLDAGESDQEVAQARGGHRVLNERLNAADAISATKANRDYVDERLSRMASGSPKEVMSTIEDLQSKYPNGEDGIFLVEETGHWYYWNNGTNQWTDGGLYQSTGISDRSVNLNKLGGDVLTSIFNETVNGMDLTWRLGHLNREDGTPILSNKTRIRSVEYVYLDRGVIRLVDYSNLKFMVFWFSQSREDSFISATDWLHEDFIVEESGWYRLNIAYNDDEEINENEIDVMGSMSRMHKTRGSESHVKKSTIMEYKYYDGVAPGERTEMTIFNGYTEIDSLEWQSDTPNALWLFVEVMKNGSWEVYNRTINRSTSLGSVEHPKNVVDLGSSMWDILHYDMESNERFFKLALRKPIVAPEGLRIFFENRSIENRTYKGGFVIRGSQS